MQSASPCTLCKEGGHTASKCPELRPPPQEGFYSGGGGGGGHDHDDEGCAAMSAFLTRPFTPVHGALQQVEMPLKVEVWATPPANHQDHYDDPNDDIQNERLRNLLFRGDGGHGPDCYELRA
jgi:hypothetical protein